jgi:hypothetical protein
MDPLTTLSVAGNVIQFVDLGIKLLRGAEEMYKSSAGALPVNKELELIATDLRSVLLKLTIFTGSNRALPDPADPETVFFMELCGEAKSIATELIEGLEKLKVQQDLAGHQRVFSSFFKVIKSAWSRRELRTLQSRLASLKEILVTRVLVSFRWVLLNPCHDFFTNLLKGEI